MKIGIISDVHSNIDALNAVLEKFDEQDVDKIICLGDVIGIGPYSEQAVKRLIEIDEKIVGFVLGNHEGYLLNGIPKHRHNREDAEEIPIEEVKLHSWNHKQLSDDSFQYIRKKKVEDIIDIEGKKIYLSHYAMEKDGKYKSFYRYGTGEELKSIYNGIEADVYLYGHTHTQHIVEHENKLYINPGSVGCPKNTDMACSVILEIDNDSVKAIECNVNYDIDKVISDIKKISYPLSLMMIKVFYR